KLPPKAGNRQHGLISSYKDWHTDETGPMDIEQAEFLGRHTATSTAKHSLTVPPTPKIKL
ncbi:MAG: hypothetical protein ACYSO3_06075, partial [Planctomycetota bacterium]